eukprot:gi/632944962/ref/XP_007887788.1/ PREDICTED: chymotrypsin-like protease CTRL-1 [Callorhinchus milii]
MGIGELKVQHRRQETFDLFDGVCTASSQLQAPAAAMEGYSPGWEGVEVRNGLGPDNINRRAASWTTLGYVIPRPDLERGGLNPHLLNQRFERLTHNRTYRVTTHPSYNAQTFNYDCTLLKLSSPAIYNGYVAPIALIPWNIDLPGGTMCTTTGWGRTESGGGKKLLSTLLKLNTLTASSNRLVQTNIPIIDKEQCKDYWGNRITNMMICAGASGSSSCQGDSGGPLVYDHNGNWILAGIVSCGTTNCNVWAPAIYSSVADASLY